ncbi:LysR family transcriptional regulator [Phenylobacterium immobile]|uniref:LysR family transcriptional regulator n=1 Tax=Phenylobacterium immobile TaxID=21 RepID=UPI000A910716|nr:LysR family transcriptional regulator [Phenylobacterium immobile]
MTAGFKPSRRLGLDLASIRLALSIAEHRSLRRAARVIGISESALSHRLRALEDVLAVALFHRSSEGVEPTQAGLVFFEQARDALRVLDLAVANAGATSRGVAGRLTLGLYTSLSTGRLRDALAAYTDRHPEVELHVVEGDRSRMVEGISSRSIDIVVLLGAPDDMLGEPLLLWRERLHIILMADHPLAERSEIAWSDIESETFLVSAHGAGPEAVQLLAAQLAGPGRQPLTRSHLISRETALSMVGMGLGIALMIESDLGRLPEGVVAVPLGSGADDALVPLTAYRDPGNDNPPLRRFWSFLKSGYVEPSPSPEG